MDQIFGVPLQALAGQLTLGLINGAFYAMLSLGLTVIFGLLRLINFTHGAQFTIGAFGAWMALQYFQIPYWGALVLVPLSVAGMGMLAERTLLRRVYEMDELFQLLLTFGLALIAEGLLSVFYGSSGLPYDNPIPGGLDTGFMFLPYYRAWIITASLGACVGTWLMIERTRLGSYLRAATERPQLVRTFGINVPRMITLTYGFGVALAALAGVLAAPMDQVKPTMGSGLIITVFAVVVIGGMGSIPGSVLTGFGLGVLEALTKVYYPPASSVVIFLIMTAVILFKRDREAGVNHSVSMVGMATTGTGEGAPRGGVRQAKTVAFLGLLALLALAPLAVYPIFLTKLLCFALFALAFNLLVGQAGLLSFGHAMFFGGSAYVTAHALKVWALPTEVAILLGTAVAALMGLVVGVVAIRRQGIYFAMITLALAQLFFYACVAMPATGGEDGISAVPRGALFSVISIADDRVLYYVVLVCFIASFLLAYRIAHSPYGQVLRAIRDNEARAVSLGYQVNRYKLVAFVMSATLAGLAGSLKVLVFRLATLVDVSWSTSGDVILMALIGGIGTVLGPLFGAAFMLTLQNWLQGLSQWMPVVQGAVFVVAVLLLPRGVAGTIGALRMPTVLAKSARRYLKRSTTPRVSP